MRMPSVEFQRFRKRGYIFTHQSRAITAWDAALMFFIVYITVYTPLVLVFKDQVSWSLPSSSIDNNTFANVRQ